MGSQLGGNVWVRLKLVVGKGVPMVLEAPAEHQVRRVLQILPGETEQIIAEFRRLAQEPKRTDSRREQLTKTANYHNIPFPSRALPEAQSLDLISSPTRSCEHSIAAQNRQELPLAA